ncbi:VOC family protein [Staphylococcus kloosii]|uniref:VOC family protein n=1 Tax=Staphylococcus kloosii TaxID=29384 RepID=UPI00189FE0B6|nr:VOC family protein [Staphylococcus kloosii]MBF7020781.1 VOC family protein [Staphylococcus kloosii]
MELKHLNLTVEVVAPTRDFFITYFEMKTEKGGNPEVLVSPEGFILTLMQGNNVTYPKTFHIGFPQSNASDVDRIHDRIKADGYKVPSPKQTAHGYTFYIKAPGNFMIEVLSY